ncbi:alpha/beta hydrolase [Alkaliphilus peptidifermentans]|uniref:Lysophospholipase, alpha-beta hydrolase superfamily n=1 Tax=Alkaliphilus peptidifermentans DSM 18978 TaxID=1120976 RepID=A0A1G5I3I2_9FIRM|nr:alpha/beta hydrolase [Alkaliphilus peptidifermentans]SCY70603.1 Lysophospholipase, alpha-beta hydrolase superfamily [Alkaliphilus peptidifermentans DSM 18978]
MVIIIVAFCLLIFITYSLMEAYYLVHSLSHPAIRKHLIGINNTLVSNKKFDFKSNTGLKLKAIEYLPALMPRGTIIAFHYLGGSKESIFPYLEFLIAGGYRVISFDFPNHGESDSQVTTKFTLDKDAFMLMEKIKEMGIGGPYGVMGLSMGATAALAVYEGYPEIKGAVIDSGPLIYVREYFDYVLNIKGIKNPLCRFFFKVLYLHLVGFKSMSENTLKSLKKLKGRPIFFIQAEKDTTIPIRNALKAFQLVKSDKAMFWSVPKSRHLTILSQNSKEYKKRVLDFFDDVFCI